MNEILKELLDDRYLKYDVPAYIDDDPIQIPHLFSKKEDVEISAFLASAIAWGQRRTIITNARKLISWMDDAPYDFVMHADKEDFNIVDKFIHRTFNGIDCMYFLQAIRNIYKYHNGLENVFQQGFDKDNTIYSALYHFRTVFFELPHATHTEKHLGDVSRNAAAKRLNMFLRWMVREDERGVDFGLWKDIPASALMLPLDVHTGNVGRALGLLTRKQNDWKSVEEITGALRRFDAKDPVKYDYALFGMGLNRELRAMR
ncbi:MAG: TIGR02757 family protein [Paludibacter sp.]|nr:TIGR02757 family protein [Paludibacter sp.]